MEKCSEVQKEVKRVEVERGSKVIDIDGGMENGRERGKVIKEK